MEASLKETVCPNCNTKIKSGFVSVTKLASKNITAIINEYSDNKAEGYCTHCGDLLYSKAKNELINEKKQLNEDLLENISVVPVITAHTPLNWDYKVIEMVTGQSVTGTGVIAEFTSTFTDLLGLQSNQYNKKIKNGENLCLFQIRKQTLSIGGNAIIATDIDYSELGSAKGMIMVCASGTAVDLVNYEILGESKIEKYNKVKPVSQRLTVLEKYIIEDSF